MNRADAFAKVILPESKVWNSWGEELVSQYDVSLAEAKSPELSEERMRELVYLAFDSSPLESTIEVLFAVEVAAKVLGRLDCPKDLLLLVATHPEWDTRLPGQGLLTAVLNRRDCPEEVRVAAALAGCSPMLYGDPEIESAQTCTFPVLVQTNVLPWGK